MLAVVVAAAVAQTGGSATSTFTATLSLPTATSAATATATLPTATGTHEPTHSPTDTQSASSSATSTLTPSETVTPERHDNYTQSIGPSEFREGEELRLRLQPTFGDSGPLNHFNATEIGTLEVSVYLHAPGTFAPVLPARPSCARHASAGQNYLVSQTREFGLSVDEFAEGLGMVSAAHVTITAPGSSFFVCFKHTPTAATEFASPLAGKWQLFSDSNTTQWLFQPAASQTWYYVPSPITTSQYAVVQVSSDEPGWNFTITPSRCSAGNMTMCGVGDNLKVVPAGQPCTYEHQALGAPYYGTHLIDAGGEWMEGALAGLVEGSTAGGAGLFGLQGTNPLVDHVRYIGVDELSVDASVHDASTFSQPVQNPTRRHVYAYVRLPEMPGQFDICFSAKARRRELRDLTVGYAAGIDSLPAWRKLRSCSSPRCVYDASPFANSRSFTVQFEYLGWVLRDYTPDSWGPIRIDAGVSADTLSTLPHLTREEDESDGQRYWLPRGGDVVRVVPATSFGETTSQLWHGGQAGSLPTAGCWTRSGDTWADHPSPAPDLTGSRDLHGDPFTAAAADDDASASAAFTSVRVASTPHYVCYRSGTTAAQAGRPLAGWRMLWWHGNESNVGWRWRRTSLANQRTYPAGDGSGPHVLLGGDYDGLRPGQCDDSDGCRPVEAAYSINDSRAGTEGAVLVEVDPANSSHTLSAALWTAVGKGSALRLVPAGRPCTWDSFAAYADAGLAHEAPDAGLPECESADAFDSPACIGSGFDGTASAIAFHLPVPAIDASPLRVCLRQGGWNWRELPPVQWWPGAPRYFHVRPNPVEHTAAGGPTVRLWFDDDRAGMEALFVVQDDAVSLSAAPRERCSSPPHCTASGDVLRLVPAGQPCNIRPETWVAAQADAELAAFCPVHGSGTMADSGLLRQPCSVLASDLCSGLPCDEATGAGEPGSQRAALSAFVRESPALYDDVVPIGHRAFSLQSVAASVVLPSPALQWKICYKQLLEGNWLVFNSSFTVRPQPAAAVAPQPDRLLLSGSLQRFVVTFPEPVSFTTNQGWYPGVPAGLAVGSVVRVRPTVASPTFGWQGASHADVGPVTSISGTDARVDFGWVQGWPARLSDLELAPAAVVPANLTKPALIDDFRAKLVDSRLSCRHPAAGSDDSFFSAATSTARAGATVHEAAFYIGVPKLPGRYLLCVRGGEDTPASWLRFGPYDAVENGVRWFVRQGSQPTNQGVSTVELARCATVPSGRCSFAANTDVFDITQGADAAKVVPRSESCHDGSDAVGMADHGGSLHAGIGEGGGGTDGVTDLGPSDGPADVAELVVTMPPIHADRPADYKVCVRTRFDVLSDRPVADRTLWAEVREAEGVAGQLVVRDDDGDATAFRTRPAGVERWSVSDELTPLRDLVAAARTGSTATLTVLAGASSRFVDVTAGSAVADGFLLHAYGNATEPLGAGQFKLVQAARPLVREPPLEGGWAWDAVRGASCLSPAVAAAVHSLPSGAPGSTVPVGLQLPAAVGEYLVCYRLADGRWLQLQGPKGARSMTTQSPYLQFVAPAGTGDQNPASNVTLMDTWSAAGPSGAVVALSSWCAGRAAAGLDCGAQNAAGYDADMVAVVGDGEMCPAPGSGSGSWHRLRRVTNASAAADDPGFRLPPAQVSASGRYRVCVLKAGDLPGGVARRGVVYQLWNRGSLANGGDSGFFHVAALEPDGLLVSTSFAFNASEQFVVYDGRDEAFYLDSRPADGSNSPLLQSGAVVDFVVRPSAGGFPVPSGSFAVHVAQCPPAVTWNALQCRVGSSATAGGFVVHNVAGACSRESGPAYGWAADGLRQFLIDGAVTFRLQYRSACPQGGGSTGGPEAGCGLRFEASLPGRAEGLGRLMSAPVWMNVEPHFPDGVRVGHIDATQHDPASACSLTSSDCPLLRCSHGHSCGAVLHPRYGGPLEFAPLGTFSVEVSWRDHESVPATALLQMDRITLPEDLRWPRGGRFDWSFVPLLQDDADTATVYFVVTVSAAAEGESAVQVARVAVEVRRSVPKAAALLAMVPADGGWEGRTPAPTPTFVLPDGTVPAFPVPSSAVVAAAGSHLEALVPYELTYGLADGEGQSVSATDLSPDWTAALSIEDLSGSAIRGNSLLQVITDDGTPTRHNLLSSPQYTAGVQAGPPQPGGMTPDGTHVYRTWVRVLNNVGCSRFTSLDHPQPGCVIRLQLSRLQSVERFSATIRIPIRVVASVVRATVGQTVTPGVAPMREGITVTVVPGTAADVEGKEMWLADEYHYGDVFALLTGPAPTDGVRTRDGTGLADTDFERGLPALHRCEQLSTGSGQLWGAQWKLLTTRPCFQCSLTFHTTWGAGPDPFDDAELTVTLQDDTEELLCTAHSGGAAAGGEVFWYYNSFTGASYPSSELFTLRVAAGTYAGAATWPRLRVSGTVPGGNGSTLSLHQHGAPAVSFTGQMGADGVAAFDGLSVEGQRPDRTSHVRVSFVAVAPEYSASVRGTVVVGERLLRCDFDIPVEPVAADDPPVPPAPAVQILDVVGATALCAVPENCTEWTLTTDTLQFTVVARGGPAYNVSASAPTQRRWRCDSNDSCVTDNTTVPSAYPDFDGAGDGASAARHLYTYGKVTATFRRNRPSFGADGRGDLHVALEPAGESNGFTRGGPLRDGRIGVCLSQWNAEWASEQFLADSCTTLRLWITPGRCGPVQACAAPQRHVGIVRASGLTAESTVVAPGVPFPPLPCGRQPAELVMRAVLYYEWHGQRVVDPRVGLRFFLRLGGASRGILIDGDAALTNGTYPTSAVLERSDGVPAGLTEADTLRQPGSRVAEWRVSVRDVFAVAAPFEVYVRDVNDPGTWNPPARLTRTEREYTFAAEDETPYTAWDVGAAEPHDDECPRKRFLARADAGYRVFSPLPGSGWTARVGSAVGVPFPVSTVVRAKQGGRAYSAPPSLVVVEKGGTAGCNDGGLLRVFKLRPSDDADERLLLAGGPDTSFVAADGGVDASGSSTVSAGSVLSQGGAATVWAMFTEPCEHCTLRLTLCHSAAAGVADCLSAAADAAGPEIQERVKVTLPFSVRLPAPDTVVVTGQSLPPAEALTGSAFTVEWAVTQAFAQWTPAGPRGAAEVWAATRLAEAELREVQRWGNGGFLAPGHADAECQTVTDALTAASPHGVGVPASASGTVTAHFVRPCARCEVWLRWRVEGGSGQSFPLRRLVADPSTGALVPGAPLAWRVRTCGVRWLLGGRPAPAVRRGKPFTLTALRVDTLNFPAWEGTGAAEVVVDAPGANGGGGDVVPSVPVEDVPNATGLQQFRVRTVGGSATARLHYTRACYQCGISFAGVQHRVAVLTPATHFVAARLDSGAEQSFTAGGSADFRFTVYAADDVGDRAYGIGGPTQLVLQPLYRQGVKGGLPLSVLPPNTTTVFTTWTAPDGDKPASVSSGDPAVTVVGGTHLVNGVVTDLGAPPPDRIGVTTVRLSGHPVKNMPVRFTAPGVDLPTREGGGALPPVVSWEGTPTTVLASPNMLSVRPASEAVVHVYAAAQFSDGSFVLGTAAVGLVAQVEWDCTLCRDGTGDCQWTAPASVPFVDGRADVAVTFHRGSGSCKLWIRATPSNASAQPVTVNVQSVDQTRWQWQSGGSSLVNGTVDSPLAAAAEGSEHTLHVAAYVNDFGRPDLWTRSGEIAWGSNEVTWSATPQGCFLPTGTVVESGGTAIRVDGVFVAAGPCEVRLDGGLPVGTAPNPLRVTTRARHLLRAVTVLTAAGPSNYSGLTLRTLDGSYAAAAGEALIAAVEVADSEGEVVTGDFETDVHCIFRRGGEVVTPAGEFGCPATVRAGTAQVTMRFAASTRRPDGSHDQWDLELVPTPPLTALSSLGPIRVAVAATRIVVDFSPTPAVGEVPWRRLPRHVPGAAAEVRWISGFTMRLRLRAEDAAGNVAVAPDEIGSNAPVSFSPVEVPCLSVDRKTVDGRPYIGTTCAPQGTCSGGSLPDCGVEGRGWFLGRGGAGGFETQFSGGERTLDAVRYLGAEEGTQVMRFSTLGFAEPSYVESYSMLFQRVAGLRLEGVECAQDGRTSACPAPHDPPFHNATEERLQTDPTSPALLLLRVAPLTAFTLRVHVVDAAGGTVSADSFSRMTISAVCFDARVNASDALFRFGKAGGVGGQQVDRPQGWDEAQVEAGAATFEDLSFAGACTNVSLRVGLACPPVDSQQDCASRAMRTALFEVGNSALPPSPAPNVLIDTFTYPTAQVLLGVGVTPDSADAGRLELALLAAMPSGVRSVVVLYVCRVAAAEVTSGITPGHRADAGTCRKYSDVPADRRPNVQQTLGCASAASCVTVAEVAIVTETPADLGQATAAVEALRAAVLDPASDLVSGGLVAEKGLVKATLPPPPRTPTPTRSPPTPLPPAPGRFTPAPKPRPWEGTNVSITTAAAKPAAGAAIALAAAAALLLH